jgi:hypothetical protein
MNFTINIILIHFLRVKYYGLKFIVLELGHDCTDHKVTYVSLNNYKQCRLKCAMIGAIVNKDLSLQKDFLASIDQLNFFPLIFSFVKQVSCE